MKARQIAAALEEIAPVSLGTADDRAAGSLGFRIGEPDRDVAAVGVAWWLGEEVVQAAVERGLGMLILHEPELFRYYASPFHTNLPAMTLPHNLRKMRRLLDHGIVVYTAHTNWDMQRDCGMAATLAQALGFSDPVGWDVALPAYRLEGWTFGRLAAHVKTRLGLPQVRLWGDDARPVRKVVLGFGSLGSEVEAILAAGADAGIFGELREWPFLAAREAGVGIIETTHLVSESVGFRGVVERLSARLPSVRFEFVEMAFPYRLA